MWSYPFSAWLRITCTYAPRTLDLKCFTHCVNSQKVAPVATKIESCKLELHERLFVSRRLTHLRHCLSEIVHRELVCLLELSFTTHSNILQHYWLHVLKHRVRVTSEEVPQMRVQVFINTFLGEHASAAAVWSLMWLQLGLELTTECHMCFIDLCCRSSCWQAEQCSNDTSVLH